MNKASFRADLFLSFVCDKETEGILTSLSLSHMDTDIKIEAQQGGIKGAIKYLKSHSSPRILLVDISESEFAASDMQSLAEVCAPNVAVIAIGERNEVGLFRELMSLGVRDYIVKPLTASLVIRSLEQLLLDSTSGGFTAQGQLVTFIGARGGVGASTLAANCAWLLGNNYSKRVGLLDMDLQFGTIAQIFDIPTARGFSEALEAPDRVDEVFVDRVMVKQSQHLSVLSSEEELGSTSKISAKSMDKLLDILLKQFHYTITDLPSNFSTSVAAQTIKKSGVIVVVVDFTIMSVRSAVRILKFIKDNQNPDQRVLLIVNKVGQYKQGEIEQQDFQEYLQCKVDLIIRFDAKNPITALNEGTPVAAENGPMSTGILAMTELLLGRQVSSPSQKNKGLINQLFAINR